MSTILQQSLRGNIRKNYLFTFLSSVALTDAIWMLFLAYRGMSLVQIGILESVFHLTGLTMEIPTGIIADRFGRKTSRVLGRILALISTALMLAADGFWGFALAFVFSALSYNLESGAGDALVYDTLVVLDETPRYMKIKGFQEVCFQTARIASLVIGGWIATFNYELGYMISLGINGLSILAALTFREPSPTQASTQEQTQEQAIGQKLGLGAHIRQSIRVIADNKRLLNYIVFIEGFSLFHTTLYFYSQSYMKSTGLSEAWIGLILGIAGLASILFSTQAHWFERRFGRFQVIRYTTVATLLVLMGLAFLPFKPLYFVAMAALDGILFVSFSDYINQLIPSASRATLLSFQAMVFSAMMIVFFPVFGWVATALGFIPAFIGVFILAIPVMGYNSLVLLRSRQF